MASCTRQSELLVGRTKMPIAFADIGGTYTISRVSGNDKVRAHLSGLGFTEGAEVTLVAETTSGYIVNVRGARIAVSRDLARRIYV